jgi:RNA polymerase sigma-70 factor (ECF subfamily)
MENVVVQTVKTAEAFTEFVREVEPRLSHALAMAYGPEAGREAAADALAYAWEHWERIGAMENPAGYLFRVGQSKARRYLPRRPRLPAVRAEELPSVEPQLPTALAGLSRRQRIAVVLIHGQGYTDSEAAELMEITRGTVRKHAERGLAKLHTALEEKR